MIMLRRGKSNKLSRSIIAEIIFIETAPASYLHPFALISFVSGFDGTRREDLRYYIEQKWKEKTDELIQQQGIGDFRELALCVNDVINRISGEDRQYQFGISCTDLTVVQILE